MMRALNTSGTGMVSQQYNLDVIANNLANVNTTGFKGQRAEFQDLVYETVRASGVPRDGAPISPVALQIGLGARFASTAPNFAPGSLQATSNPLDLAINGSGFLKVKQQDGTIVYTRDGSLKVDANGSLVTSDGLKIDPEVKIPKDATSINVATNGTITVILPGSANAVPVDPPIQITMFPNPSGMQRVGQNLYRANDAAGEAVEGLPGENGAGTIQSGFLEGSNVQVVEEMVRMIQAQRAYEINSKAVQTSDEMLSTLNNLKR